MYLFVPHFDFFIKLSSILFIKEQKQYKTITHFYLKTLIENK